MPIRRRSWILNFALWTVIALIQTFQNYTGALSEGVKPHLSQIFVLQVATWLPWAFLAPVVFTLARRFPLERLVSVRALVHLPLIAFAFVCMEVGFHTLGMMIAPQESGKYAAFVPTFFVMLRWMILPQMIVFAGIVGASHAINYHRKLRDRELQTAQLEQQLTEARLLSLQMQLQPHFFFNTLHSIAALVRTRQNKAAVTMIARLSDLLRYTLDQVDKQKVPLKQELDFLHQYLEIEQTRFSDRLNVEMNVDPDVMNASIPSLLLQPIVENAIRHGIAVLPRPGALTILARRSNGDLSVEVSNDGTGIGKNGSKGSRPGMGLNNVRSRLEQLYGTRQQFNVEERDDGKVVASVVIPFEESQPEER